MNDLKEIKIVDQKCLLGLDIGDQRIGVAVSDRNLMIASGIMTIHRSTLFKDIANLLQIIQKYQPQIIVCGWPVQMNGIPGTQCKKVADFIDELSKHTNIPFAKWDERFSTKVVEQVMIKANLSREKRKNVIDKTAAVYILQGAIDFIKTNRSES